MIGVLNAKNNLKPLHQKCRVDKEGEIECCRCDCTWPWCQNVSVVVSCTYVDKLMIIKPILTIKMSLSD